MPDTVIRVEGLGKKYRLGVIRHSTLRDRLAHALAAPRRWGRRRAGGDPGDFWALRDVSFEVGRGEVLGIIGRNGAGKSTLLKVLSRITEPTTGRVTLTGRLASLLEVGTGFHPELSGRENIFLNGAILGMSRAEIRRKFDEIVAFAEVEQFLDTPVKHYSSGMYVRLAFAVAAHLEPEILVVDEVLAVGDAAFQQKCLGKIREVSTHDGRTVLLVSHNMDSIIRLCRKAMLLAHGRIEVIGAPLDAVSRYARVHGRQAAAVDCRAAVRPAWAERSLVLERVEHAGAGAAPWAVPFGGDLAIACELAASRTVRGWSMFLAFFSASGVEVAAIHSPIQPPATAGSRPQLRCRLADFRLTPGSYVINIGVRAGPQMTDLVAAAATIEVLPTEHSAELQTAILSGFYVPNAEFAPAGPGPDRPLT